MKKSSILRDYRAKHGVSCKEFASSLGISESTLRSYENGWRVIPAEICNAIERLTNREVCRDQLRPEIFSRQAA